MPVWAASLLQGLVDFAVQASGYIAAFFAGKVEQQSKDQQKVIDAATARAQVENADRQLSDDQLRDRLRAKP